MTKHLVLEKKAQPDETVRCGPMALTPHVREDYWMFRVRLTAEQAVVAFPKFRTVGIGFAVETDWNTNLPYTCDAVKIYEHIAHNVGDDSITREDCVAAIRLLQDAIEAGVAGAV
ncbi:hypothetical protein B4N89_27510 [Embleya scabrispora]|uniref:Uncharacterized protein n=1 Tax=Embleya scabrispora TaxID=159449 RepID=A0A1T3P5F0_9ACTN|nr:hypothetical protein [Embleya scabrispora]OPC84175.1 hypothetical protein B4N89_27510 [Embleya scabrispora]